MSGMSRVGLGRLRSGDISHSDWDRISEAVDCASRLDLHVDDQGALTIDDIRSKVLGMSPPPKVVILDYLQLCSGMGEGNRNSELEAVSRGLKSMAMSMDILIIALIQLNREVDRRVGQRPILSDCRDSGSIEQDGDAICFLRPLRDLTDGHKLRGFEVAAQRDGPTGDIALDFDGSHQVFADSHEPIEQEQERPARRGFAS